jgi:hypothetical protein
MVGTKVPSPSAKGEDYPRQSAAAHPAIFTVEMRRCEGVHGRRQLFPTEVHFMTRIFTS